MQIEFLNTFTQVELVDFFTSSFPNRATGFWTSAINALESHCTSEFHQVAPKAAILREDGEIAACMLILQKTSVAVSLSSWAVRPESGHLAYPFLRAVIKRLAGFNIYNHSAVPGVDKLMHLVGFQNTMRCWIPKPTYVPLFGRDAPAAVKADNNVRIFRATSGRSLRFKCLSLTRDHRFRRLAMLLDGGSDTDMTFIRIWSAWCLTRFMIPIAALPDTEAVGLQIAKFGNMCRPCEGDLVAGVSWYETYSRSEFELFDF